MPVLTDVSLALLKEGILYIHGRCIDQCPIIIMDFGNLSRLLRNGLQPETLSHLSNFLASYILNNMLVPGQVEKWIFITNLNGFSLKELPVPFFLQITQEFTKNYIDRMAKSAVVNLSWV